MRRNLDERRETMEGRRDGQAISEVEECKLGLRKKRMKVDG